MENYGGRQPNTSAYVKYFQYGTSANLWNVITYTKSDGTTVPVITGTSDVFKNVFIAGDLFVGGSIISPSDVNLKKNINVIDTNKINNLMNLKPTQFTFKNDPLNHIHYGFIAQEFETEFPELVSIKPDKTLANIKAINYLEIIPLLVNKIQLMQKEIEQLKEQMKV